MNQSYFKPLRRKIGVVILVFACAFVAGWIRSLHLQDDVCLAGDTVRCDLFSREGRLWFMYATYDEPRTRGFLFDSSTIQARIDTAELPSRQSRLDWRWDWLGFHLSSSAHFRHGMIPYWSIVVPLTLLSAYLLMGKFREGNMPQAKPAINQQLRNTTCQVQVLTEM